MSRDLTVACYYFPNYHVDPRNEARHGRGWTEWELVKRGEPRFPGHQQPKVPLWGCEDEADPSVMEKKIAAAADHGIDAFIFDWYYYNDGPFLERGIEHGFFNAPNNARLKFAVMWANHDWVDIHPSKRNSPPQLQFAGVVTPETFDKMTDFLVGAYFSHPSYWCIDGCPYFSVYELSKFVANFGGVEQTRRAVEQFRAKVRAAGFRDLHLNAVVWGRPILPGEKGEVHVNELIERVPFDSVTSYVWIHHVPLDRFPQTPFEDVRDRYFAYARDAFDAYGAPYYPNATMGWDATPRVVQSDTLENSGYPSMATISGNTPEAFAESVVMLREMLGERPENERILTINCWNEWTEGSYLEPDAVSGMAYLEALREALRGVEATEA